MGVFVLLPTRYTSLKFTLFSMVEDRRVVSECLNGGEMNKSFWSEGSEDFRRLIRFSDSPLVLLLVTKMIDVPTVLFKFLKQL